MDGMDKGTEAIIELTIIKYAEQTKSGFKVLLSEAKKEIKEHCDNTAKQLISDVQKEGCKGMSNHLIDHKESKKRLFGLITIIPAVIAAVPAFIKWLKGL